MERTPDVCSKARLAIVGMAITTLATQFAFGKETFTDPKDPGLPVDFSIQGEYVGSIKGGGELGCQVGVVGRDDGGQHE